MISILVIFIFLIKNEKHFVFYHLKIFKFLSSVMLKRLVINKQNINKFI